MSPGQCRFCARCCRHVSLEIDVPEDREDFDNIRWYLLHKDVSVFIDDGKWYLEVLKDCMELTGDGRCGIYEGRPDICREYEAGECEREGHYWDIMLRDTRDLDGYLAENPADS